MACAGLEGRSEQRKGDISVSRPFVDAVPGMGRGRIGVPILSAITRHGINPETRHALAFGLRPIHL